MPVAKISCIPGVSLEGLSALLMAKVTAFQSYIACPVIVTSALREGDPAEHGKGLAIDIIVPAYEGRLMDLYLAAERFNFGGIGVYPDWHYNGMQSGGLHVDVRMAPGKGARWTGIKDKSGKNQYLALDKSTLSKLGVI